MTQGDPFSPLWLVGEAPGETEVKTGVPFSGPSGWLLNECLASARINREECFVTNVCLYRPPGNDIKAWIGKRPAGPGWVRYEDSWLDPRVAEGIRRLEGIVVQYKPKTIIALGDTALWALTGKRGITLWRGSTLSCRWRPETVVVPTLHPAYVLRNYGDRVELVCDLTRARTARLPGPEWKMLTRPSVEMALAYLDALPDPFVMDIETCQGQIRCVGVSPGPTEAMCIPIWDVGWSLEEELALAQGIRRALETKRVVGQNFLYDSFYLALLWGSRPRVAFDTMVAQGCLFPGRPKALDYLASLYAEHYVYWKKDSKDASAWTPQELWVYNCQDCIYTWQVWKKLEQLLDQLHQREQFEFLMSLYPPVHEMMLRGIKCDENLKAKIAALLDSEMSARLGFLGQALGHEINPLNPHQLKALLYEDLRLAPIVNRKTGKPTTDDDALKKISMREPILGPVVKAIREYRTIHLLKANVLDAQTPGGRMFTSYNPVGTSTFRFNSTSNPMGWGTNLQNIFKKDDDDPEKEWLPSIRELFRPDPGMVLLEFDLSKADLRVVVWESEEEELKEALRKGINIYRDIAADVVRMPYKKAKMFCHGTNYGGRPRTMAAHCGITVHEAEVAQTRWFERFPGIRKWHQRVESELRTLRRVSNKFGFRMLFFERLDSVLPEALAWCPQSTVAIVTNKALRRIWELRLGELLLQVHDSVVIQVPEAEADEVRRRVMEIYASIVVPYDDPLIIPAECKMGKDWHNMVTCD